jgi:hypothetical protein
MPSTVRSCHGVSTQNSREVTKNKAALSTKKPRSVPGFIVRVQQTHNGFKKMRLYFSAVFQHKTAGRSQKVKPLFQQQKAPICTRLHYTRTTKPQRLSGNAASFQCGLSAQNMNNREATKNKAALSTKKAAVRARLHCTRATKPQRLSGNAALFQCGLSAQNTNNREATKNKATLSTKKPRSVPGFIVRVQQTRSGFRKMRLYFSAVVQHKITERSQKTKPLFQQKSRNPCQASLCACNKAAAALEKFGFVSAARLCQSRSPWLRPLAYPCFREMPTCDTPAGSLVDFLS